MFGNKSLRVSVLFMVLVVALASLGVVNALWSDALEVNGTVQTGSLEAILATGPVNEIEEKDVATCEANLRDDIAVDDENDAGPDKLEILIDGGYPSFACEVPLAVENIGTVPFHIEEVLFTEIPDALTVELLDCWPADFQVHGGESTVAEFPNCRVRVHVEQPAAEGATYSFMTTFLAFQYNEQPPTGEEMACSQGFWSNNFDAWPPEYTPNTLVGDVWTVPPELSDLADDTLAQALGYAGGPDTLGGAQILLQQAVAALLNAEHDNIAYPLTVQQIVDGGNSALASLDRDTMIALADQLEMWNSQLPCPLDADEAS